MAKFKPKTIPENAHPLVQSIFDEMNNQKMTYIQLADKAGISFKILERWRTGVTPQLQTLAVVLTALNLTLTVVRINYD